MGRKEWNGRVVLASTKPPKRDNPGGVPRCTLAGIVVLTLRTGATAMPRITLTESTVQSVMLVLMFFLGVWLIKLVVTFGL